MKNSVVVVFTLTASLFAFCANQANAECNFDRPAGGCSGTIEILSSGGKKPSFSAEARVTSSAGACSKVEFYVNSTPYTSIIRSDGVENESLSSSSPIKKSDIKVAKCTSYEGGSGKTGENVGGSIAGTWVNDYHNGDGSTRASSSMTLSEKNGRISGSGTTTITSIFTYRGEKMPPVTTTDKFSVSGTRSGDQLTLTLGKGTSTYTLNGNSLRGHLKKKWVISTGYDSFGFAKIRWSSRWPGLKSPVGSMPGERHDMQVT